MGEHGVRIRRTEERDYPFLLQLNEENVAVLSPMDQVMLERFADGAELLLTAEADDRPAAFLIALREQFTGYGSENYRWFQENYARFLYIDRVVVHRPYRGLGIGRDLYREVFHRAQITGVPFVTAEVDTVPYNEASLKFHAAMGFREVGAQVIRGGRVQVSLLEAAVRPSP